MFNELVPDTAGAVYADKAYDDEGKRELMKARKIKSRILFKASRNKKLLGWQVSANKRNSRVRSYMERVIAVMKRYRNLGRMVYRGIDRAFRQVCMVVVTHNLRRAAVLGPPVGGWGA